MADLPPPPLRWGILSTASIVDSFLTALRGARSGGRITAVASRSADRAAAFVASRLANRGDDDDPPVAALGDYAALLDRPDVDAVYIPLPTALATGWALRAVAAGKHVLVDKPFASSAEVASIAAAAAAAGLIFLDGTHWPHAPRPVAARAALTAGRVGRLRRIVAAFCAPVTVAGDIRGDPALEPHGALGDLGWYCARVAAYYLGAEAASAIVSAYGVGRWTDGGGGAGGGGGGDGAKGSGEARPPPRVLLTVAAVVEFATGVTLSFDVDFCSGLRQTYTLVGDDATLTVDGFVIPPASSLAMDPLRPPGVAASTDDAYTLAHTASVGEGGGDAAGAAVPAAGAPPLPPRPIALDYPTAVEVTVPGGGRNQPAHMVDAFTAAARGGDAGRATAAAWAAEAVATQRIVDVLYQSVVERRVVYPAKEA